jgi:hypothetical protein
MSDLLREYAEAGHQISGAGVVVGSLIDPRTIANDHIRIHALEGQLFRTVVTSALSRRRVACSVWRDRDLPALAVERLRKTEHAVRTALVELKPEGSGPWRAEQKAAALAAWIVLVARTGKASP